MTAETIWLMILLLLYYYLEKGALLSTSFCPQHKRLEVFILKCTAQLSAVLHTSLDFTLIIN